MIKKIFAPAKNSPSANLALLVLRVWIGLEMLIVHGIDKVSNFSGMAPHFPDPFGIGHNASLALSVFAEFFISLFIIIGLFTRWSALVLMINMTVAFIGVHKAALTGDHSGELAFLYLMGLHGVVCGRPGPGFGGQVFVRRKYPRAAALKPCPPAKGFNHLNFALVQWPAKGQGRQNFPKIFVAHLNSFDTFPRPW
ncbi:MAG: DoxX family protein [Limisphaerales bacterium]